MAGVYTAPALANNYLRIAGTAIAAYDYFLTLPAEIKLYRSQKVWWRPSRACLLFFLVRYTSILAIVIAGIASFGTGFSKEACQRYYLLPAITLLIPTFVSHYIMVIRTYAISHKKRWVWYFLWIMFIVAIIAETFTFLYLRSPVQGATHNCGSGFTAKVKIGWIRWLITVLFDTAVTILATIFLWRFTAGVPLIDGLSQLLFKDGLMYFIILTLSNILNLVLFSQNTVIIQGAGTPLGEAFTMIMSQKIIISLTDAFGDQQSSNDPRRMISSHDGVGHRRTYQLKSVSNIPGFLSKTTVEESPPVELHVRVQKDVEVNVESYHGSQGVDNESKSFSGKGDPAWEV